MQIKELARSLQIVWGLFTDPRVIGIIDPAAAGGQPLWARGSTGRIQSTRRPSCSKWRSSSSARGERPLSGLDRAILLDQVFAWVQGGQAWHPDQGCEEDQEFVDFLGAMSALVSGAGERHPFHPHR